MNWFRTLPARPRALGTLVAVVVLVVAIGRIEAGFRRGGPAPSSGPPNSSFATSPGGLAAWAELLAASGHRVERLRERFGQAPTDSRATVVLVGVDPDPAEFEALQTHLSAGGRVVGLGLASAERVAEAAGLVVGFGGPGPTRAVPAVPVPEVAGVSSVTATGFAMITDAGAALPVVVGTGEGSGGVAGRGRASVVVATAAAGPGSVVIGADPSPFTNELLDEADNAALALAVVGAGRPVQFLEAGHGFGRREGLRAIPAGAQRAAWVLLAAAAAWAWSRGRRLGPPADEARPLPPARREYVEAVAATVARTGDRAVAVAALRRRASLPEGPVDDDDALLEVGRAAAAAERRRRP